MPTLGAYDDAGAALARLADAGISAVVLTNSGKEQTKKLLEHAVNRPPTPLYPRVSAQLQAMLEAVLSGRLKPAAAANRAADLIAAITGLHVAET